MQETAPENAREMPRENARDPVSMGTASATAKSTERPASLLSAVSVDRSSAVHQSKYDSKNRRVPRSQQHDSMGDFRLFASEPCEVMPPSLLPSLPSSLPSSSAQSLQEHHLPAEMPEQSLAAVEPSVSDRQARIRRARVVLAVADEPDHEPDHELDHAHETSSDSRCLTEVKLRDVGGEDPGPELEPEFSVQLDDVSADETFVEKSPKRSRETPTKTHSRKSKDQRVIALSRTIREALAAADESAAILLSSTTEGRASDSGSVSVFNRQSLSAHDLSGVNSASLNSTGLAGEKRDIHARKAVRECHEYFVPLGNRACDELIGGGLACGAVHEICGLCDPLTAATPTAVMTTLAATHSTPRGATTLDSCDAIDRTSDRTSDHASDRTSDHASPPRAFRNDIVAFGCLLHIAWSAILRAELAGRSVVWIGDRIHPHAAALMRPSTRVSRDGGDARLLRASVFVSDAVVCDGLRDRFHQGVSNGTSKRTRQRHGAREHEQAARQRLWCAEQALHMGGAGVVILDGDGLTPLGWRRLQLAAANAEFPALMLVVTRPDSSGQWSLQARSAATRWSVHAAGFEHEQVRAREEPQVRDVCHEESLASDAPAASDARERTSCAAVHPKHEISPDTAFAFHWRMKLRATRCMHGGSQPSDQESDRDVARRVHSQHAASGTHSSRAHFSGNWEAQAMSRMSEGRIGVSVHRPRISHGSEEWDQLALRTRDFGTRNLRMQDLASPRRSANSQNITSSRRDVAEGNAHDHAHDHVHDHVHDHARHWVSAADGTVSSEAVNDPSALDGIAGIMARSRQELHVA